MNGQHFLAADDALRGRKPMLVEWKGAHRPPGDEVVPADLRIDHVYFVSCKYLSRIVVNASPHHLFDRLLAGGQGVRGGDWFLEVAPAEVAALYDAVRVAAAPQLPEQLTDLDAAATQDARAHASRRLAGRCRRVLRRARGAHRRRRARSAWHDAMRHTPDSMLWRLLRIGSAPYFVLGVQPTGFLRLRIATPWDWRREFELRCVRRRTAQWWAAHGRLARGRARPGPPARNVRSRDTSRCAGVTVGSRHRPKPRCTSTPDTTTSPATSRSYSPANRAVPRRADAR